MSNSSLLIFNWFAIGCIYVFSQQRARTHSSLKITSTNSSFSLWGDLIAFLVGIEITSFFFLLTGRLYLSSLISCALILFLLSANKAKEQILREPLVLADIWLLPQVWKYPEMYFPFLPMRIFLAVAIGILLSIGSFILLEKRIPLQENGLLYFSSFVLAVFPFLFTLCLRYSLLPDIVATFLLKRIPVSHNASLDAQKNGALASALMHPVFAGQFQKHHASFLSDPMSRPEQSRWTDSFEGMLENSKKNSIHELPHVLLVQAESFCDIRERLTEEQKKIFPDILKNYDELYTAGRILPTPLDAFGAYTMRTEFTALTGLAMEDLGPFAFNPYILAARQPLWSLARYFNEKGYETICLHPYHNDFFQRAKVMEHFGFQRFLGINELHNLERFGSYTSDLALGEKALEEIAGSDKPVFCFVITIESHGPWMKGRFTEQELRQLSKKHNHEFTSEISEVDMYLCHLARMDRLLGLLNKPHDKNISLWAYGDHPPSFLSVSSSVE